MNPTLHTHTLGSLPLLARGKVRDNYAVGDDRILMVASDRISAFDVVMGEPIPGKGALLTQMALFWFDRLGHICPNHLTGDAPESVVSEYQDSQSVCGVPLPAGLKNASRLPEPIFTPAAKAEMGEHDENISFEQTVAMIGADLAERIRSISIALYETAYDIAAAKGIIIADTKFEFGLSPEGTLVLMDEVLTPDSSRYWPADAYREGANPPSFDKQYLRDWLETAQMNGKPWNKTAPAPVLPSEVISLTADKYQEAWARLRD